ncbi:hypothetical protein DOTSEDRAFT_50523 [Dothistroma septosporum NZE10]|uniref:Uncharacterized protein n=1 Tax=Dothistroma septosporum (strain NZE10 / CBS 128990) TaxID=675120 RepID=N1PUG0_DOTSN|nr:hypothetical protein DOTSEDRAFT_50523 [Dothistroma septosporum NZE10]
MDAREQGYKPAPQDSSDSEGDMDHPRSCWARLFRENTALRLWASIIIGFALGAISGQLWRSPEALVLGRAQIYPTELGRLRDELELERPRFEGTALFDADGKAYFKPQNNQYVGQSRAVTDKAWNDLIARRYFFITAEEARDVWGEGYAQYYHVKGMGYIAGLEVLHELHCLEKLRHALLYGSVSTHQVRRHNASAAGDFADYHIDHCLNSLRQSVQCHGDLTPIPLRWWDSLGRPFTDSDQIHTCRNFTKIRDWATRNWPDMPALTAPETAFGQ